VSRQPIDQQKASRIPVGYEGLWQVIREKRRFTVVEVQDETGHRKDTVRDYVKRLERAGYVKMADARRINAANPTKIYALVKDVGREAPRLRRDGSPCYQGRNREQMWRTMKMLSANGGTFSPRDLAVAATTEVAAVDVGDAKDYAKHLLKAGYLVLVKASNPHRQAEYRLVRNTGPKPPMVQRVKQVFDPNLNAVVWPRPEVDLNTTKRGRR
jgi:hypothetical protein